GTLMPWPAGTSVANTGALTACAEAVPPAIAASTAAIPAPHLPTVARVYGPRAAVAPGDYRRRCDPARRRPGPELPRLLQLGRQVLLELGGGRLAVAAHRAGVLRRLPGVALARDLQHPAGRVSGRDVRVAACL